MVAHTKMILHRIVDRVLCYQSLRFISVFDGPIFELSENAAYTSRKFPTVSTIINKTMPVENVMILRKWQEKMRKQMGDKEFNDYITRIKGLGKDVHQAICDIIQGQKRMEDFPGPIEGYIRSLETVLSHVKATHLVEKDCFHPLLKYRGRLDSINSFKVPTVSDSGYVLTEWKTVHESKRVTSLEKAYDAPMQVAAYAGAYNFTRSPDMPEVRQGLITYAYADGYPADVLILDEDTLEHYFQTWANRVEAYHQSQRSASQ
ncbi:hypothetical protein ACTXT7_012054 [Hymenolepis weldensis]